MRKLRVFQTVKRKRIVPGFSLKSLGAVLLLLFFLPYFCSFLFGNVKGGDRDSELESIENQMKNSHEYVCNITPLGRERIPMETYVADKLARSIDTGYEAEALKAQAVLIRSELLVRKRMQSADEDIVMEDEEYGNGLLTGEIMQAVAETAGVYLSYEGEPVRGPYFAVSNGATRDGEELGFSEYSYLKKVLCDRDFLSSDYSEEIRFHEVEFERIWQQCDEYRITEEEIIKNEKVRVEKEEPDITVYRDSSGYVLYMERGGKFVSGEQMRTDFYLPSASFHIEKNENEICFDVRGMGHGIGMSQFAANEMAKKGDDYVTILNYFFQDTTISKFE